MKIKNIKILPLLSLIILAACGGPIEVEAPKDPVDSKTRVYNEITGGKKFFGQDVLSFGTTKRDFGGGAGGGIDVNAYLWRAALDTVSFMPLSQVDPFGGVIITDWYANPQTPNERFKIQIYLLKKQLSGDALRCNIFKQVKNSNQNWDDAAVAQNLVQKFENSILERARELRIADKDQPKG